MAVRFTKEGDGHMNRLTQKVQAGKLCDMETAPKFISCGKSLFLEAYQFINIKYE